jgi:hypothetical protein
LLLFNDRKIAENFIFMTAQNRLKNDVCHKAGGISPFAANKKGRRTAALSTL